MPRKDRSLTLTPEEEALIQSPLSDVFAKALDKRGWMIVPQPEWVHMGARWHLKKACADCPSWAVNGIGRGRFEIIGGGKKD
jgi:hypothetical protein